MADRLTAAERVDAALSPNAPAAASAAAIAAGEAAVTPLVERLDAARPAERDTIIAILDGIGSPTAVDPLLPLLASGQSGARSRAARVILGIVLTHGRPESEAFDRAVLKALCAGADAAVLLLAGLVPAAAAALNSYRDSTVEVQRSDFGPSVYGRIPANIALARLGDADARVSVLTEIASARGSRLRFYLSVLPLIEDRTVLSMLAENTLHNLKPQPDSRPSGAGAPRRIADIAVDAFAARLALDTGFPIDRIRRYTDKERDRVHALVRNALPAH
ncbi:MAG: hypothetical protein AAGJ94_11205 [Pseudomonadota bacterium]